MQAGPFHAREIERELMEKLERLTVDMGDAEEAGNADF
jgi:hypothetical protein